jgi:cation diffusion facilitator family transporter
VSHQPNSLRSIFYALAANISIAIAKLVAALVTNSGSMMAESIHSFADCGNQGLLLLGVKQAKRPPDSKHPLGYGKTVYFWSFIVAIMLFSMGGLFSIYEGTHKLHDNEGLSSPVIAIGVLVFAIVAEGLSLAGCIREVNKVKGERSYFQWFRDTRQSELMVIFGEDLAALFGLTFALLAITLTLITGNPIYDAMGSIVIGLLLLVIAVLIGKEVKDLIIGQGVEAHKHEAMVDFLKSREDVAEVYNLLTLQLGNDVMVAIKARMTPKPSDVHLIQAINDTEAAFRLQFPEVVWCFFEPDIKD